jgi:hypothetical protein
MDDAAATVLYQWKNVRTIMSIVLFRKSLNRLVEQYQLKHETI